MGSPGIVCIAGAFTGAPFLRERRRQGARVILVTPSRLSAAPWPASAEDTATVVPDDPSLDDWMDAIVAIAREEKVDRLVALDDHETLAAARRMDIGP
jgi:hypothetical protein